MKLRQSSKAFAVVVALALPGVALSATECPTDLASADTAIAAGPRENVTAESFEEARNLRVEAGRLLEAGDDAACMDTIGHALELLGIAVNG